MIYKDYLFPLVTQFENSDNFPQTQKAIAESIPIKVCQAYSDDLKSISKQYHNFQFVTISIVERR